MEKVKPRTLSGFMELLPAPQVQMERDDGGAARDLQRCTASTPLDTPLIESAEVLLAKGGGETEKQIYRFTKGDSDLALRFDLTVPLAKYVALHYNELDLPVPPLPDRQGLPRRARTARPFPRVLSGGHRRHRRRQARHHQRGRDSVASSTRRSRRWVSTASRSASTTARCSNGFYAMLGLTEKAGDIMRTVDKLDKIGAEKVRDHSGRRLRR